MGPFQTMARRMVTGIIEKFYAPSASYLAQSIPSLTNRGALARMPWTEGVLAEQFRSEVWVYACANIISSKIAMLPIRIYTQNKAGETEYVTEHPFLDIVNRPSATVSKYNFIYLLNAYRELNGQSFINLGNDAGLPLTYEILPAHAMMPEQRENSGVISSWVLNGNRTIPASWLVHWMNPNPLDPFVGLSPIQAVRMGIQGASDARVANAQIFRNGARLEGYWNAKEKMGAEEFERNATVIEAKYAGAENAHKTPVLTGGFEFKPFTLPMRDLEYTMGLKLTKEEICAAYSVPVVLMNTTDAATYNNLKTAKEQLFVDCILPRLTCITDGLDAMLHRYPGTEKMHVEFDLSGVSELKQDMDKTSRVAQRLHLMGVPLNTLLEAFDFPIDAVDGGDVSYLPLSLLPAGTDRSTIPVAPATGKAATKDVKRAPTEADIAAHWKSFVAITDAQEGACKRDVAAWATVLRGEVLSNLGKNKNVFVERVKGARSSILWGIGLDDIRKQLDIDALLWDEATAEKRYRDMIVPNYKQTAKRVGQRELDKIGFTADPFDVTNPRVVAWMEKHALENAVSVTGTMRDKVGDELIAGVDLGESIPELSARVRDAMSGWTEMAGYATERIARTEIIGAANEGALESYVQAGVEKKAWVAALDERTRLSHLEAGQIYADGIPIGDDFKVGAGRGAAPGQIGLPEEDINCRCTIIPIIEEKE